MSGLADEQLHFRIAPLIVRALDIDESGLAYFGGMIEFAFCWRYSLAVFKAIIIAEDTEIKIAPVEFTDINGIRPPITGREVFKQKDLEESVQKRIIFDKRLYRSALCRQSWCFST